MPGIYHYHEGVTVIECSMCKALAKVSSTEITPGGWADLRGGWMTRDGQKLRVIDGVLCSGCAEKNEGVLLSLVTRYEP